MPGASDGFVGGAPKPLKPAKVRPRDVDVSLYRERVADYFRRAGKRVGAKQVDIWAARYGSFFENVSNRHAWMGGKWVDKAPIGFGAYFGEKTKKPSGWLSKTVLGKIIGTAINTNPLTAGAGAALGKAFHEPILSDHGFGSLAKAAQTGVFSFAKNIKKNPSGALATAAGAAAGNPFSWLDLLKGGGGGGAPGAPAYGEPILPQPGGDTFPQTPQQPGIPPLLLYAGLAVGALLLWKMVK